MNISDSKDKLTATDIENFEKKIKHLLPDDYKKFLLENNGGHPENCVFSYAMDDKENESLVNIFNAIYTGKTYNLLIDYEYYQEQKRIPKNMLPIADDPFGNLICLSISGKDYGSVYFWDHELEVLRPAFENLFLISDSFQDFIDNLKPE